MEKIKLNHRAHPIQKLKYQNEVNPTNIIPQKKIKKSIETSQYELHNLINNHSSQPQKNSHDLDSDIEMEFIELTSKNDNSIVSTQNNIDDPLLLIPTSHTICDRNNSHDPLTLIQTSQTICEPENKMKNCQDQSILHDDDTQTQEIEKIDFKCLFAELSTHLEEFIVNQISIFEKSMEQKIKQVVEGVFDEKLDLINKNANNIAETAIKIQSYLETCVQSPSCEDYSPTSKISSEDELKSFDNTLNNSAVLYKVVSVY